jgi:hypothetical protein
MLCFDDQFSICSSHMIQQQPWLLCSILFEIAIVLACQPTVVEIVVCARTSARLRRKVCLQKWSKNLPSTFGKCATDVDMSQMCAHVCQTCAHICLARTRCCREETSRLAVSPCSEHATKCWVPHMIHLTHTNSSHVMTAQTMWSICHTKTWIVCRTCVCHTGHLRTIICACHVMLTC